MKLKDLRSRTAEILWQQQRDAPAGGGGHEVEETIHTTTQREWVMDVAIWFGLFGGCPSKDENPGSNYDYETAKKLGQVQEITCDVYAEPPTGARRALWQRDLHQLEPSASFEGWKNEQMVFPVELPEGTRIFMVTRTSQKDRGAHTRARVSLSRVDPYAWARGEG